MTQTEESTRRPMAVNVRRATMAEMPTLIDVMARAFDDDPIANFFAAQDAKRHDRIRNMMAVGLRRLSMPHGETYTTEDLLGAAQWTPPGKWKLGTLQQLLLIPPMVRTTTLRRIPRVMGGLAAIEKKHPHKRHFYLLALGVEPEYQGRGVGTALMRPILERCDREGIPAYLESSKERNVPLYERNGFKVTEELFVPNGGSKIWLMWRDPK